MSKKLKLVLFILALLIIITIGYCFYLTSNYKDGVPVQNLPSPTIISVPPEVINQAASSTESTSSTEIALSTQTVSYLISPDDTTKYCNGVDMDSAGYEKTITIEKSTSTPEINPTIEQKIKTIVSAATTGMCRSVLSQLNITEDNGVVSIPPIDGWAGVSITMCSCKPQVEVNLLRIPGVTKVIWSK
jgi:hypothetical protein